MLMRNAPVRLNRDSFVCVHSGRTEHHLSGRFRPAALPGPGTHRHALPLARERRGPLPAGVRCVLCVRDFERLSCAFLLQNSLCAARGVMWCATRAFPRIFCRLRASFADACRWTGLQCRFLCCSLDEARSPRLSLFMIARSLCVHAAPGYGIAFQHNPRVCSQRLYGVRSFSSILV